jgi:hypothetical protein
MVRAPLVTSGYPNLPKIATKLADILSTFTELCFACYQTKCINGPEMTSLASKLDDEHDFGFGLVQHGSAAEDLHRCTKNI